jgi:hypothetical protein
MPAQFADVRYYDEQLNVTDINVIRNLALVPEPTSALMVLAGAVGLGLRRRRTLG